MDDVLEVIYNFAGTSLTSRILSDVLTVGKIMKCSQFVDHGGMKFFVERVCTCNDKCGGIRCTPVMLLNLIGLTDEHLDNDESNELFHE